MHRCSGSIKIRIEELTHRIARIAGIPPIFTSITVFTIRYTFVGTFEDFYFTVVGAVAPLITIEQESGIETYFAIGPRIRSIFRLQYRSCTIFHLEHINSLLSRVEVNTTLITVADTARCLEQIRIGLARTIVRIVEFLENHFRIGWIIEQWTRVGTIRYGLQTIGIHIDYRFGCIGCGFPFGLRRSAE